MTYARRSTARPDASGAPPDARVVAGAAPAGSRGWRVVHRFKDVGRSGWDPKAVRPGCESLMDAARAGELGVGKAVCAERARSWPRGERPWTSAWTSACMSSRMSRVREVNCTARRGELGAWCDGEGAGGAAGALRRAGTSGRAGERSPPFPFG
ncbi:recombinase family protein [Streptomyces sp. GS7]|uniref:recombinase family protein n=1 Tax=Streptomyces sp. GS7 TaxID=2692234 RepID=UPI0013180566|nr:recombinase family protein [Streptomyces sp. GS7]QHC27356.1 recombinase family protein [Streptomyces sp. GS7]